MIDPDHLLNFPIPEVRQDLNARDAALYALSIGLGQNSLDRWELPYSVGRTVFPTMAVVLGHPGFWLGDPRTGVDATRLVHGEQGITLLCPMPTEGVVVGSTRVVGLVDKGEGRGAVLYSRKEVRTSVGDLLCVTDSATFLRGDGGFAGPGRTFGTVPAMPHDRGLPSDTPDIVVDLATRAEQALYYRLNGDNNPLHVDPDVAAAAGFPRPILHGLCTFGTVARALLHSLGGGEPEALSRISMRFSAPVYPGETVRAEIWRDGSFRARVPERDTLVISKGHATFRAAILNI